VTVTGRFVALICLGIVPTVLLGRTVGLAALVALGWLVLICILGGVDLMIAASPRAVAIERSVPARVRLGEDTTAALYLTNLGTRTLRARVRDAWQPSAGAPSTRFVVVIPTGERRRIVVHLRPFRRGERRVDQVTIRSSGPLRLWSRQATMNAPGRIRVLPPFVSRKHLPSRLTRLRELDGRTSVMIRGQGTEFDSLREYVRGDDVRSIDWRATARRAGPDASGTTLMVRTWRPERDRRVVIVIDSSRTSAARIDNEPRIDTAFEAALLLAALASKAGDRVDTIVYDRRMRGRIAGATGADLLSRMVDSFAGIDPELIEMDWQAIDAQVRGVTGQHALVVLLTSIETPGASHGLLEVLPQLVRRHTVVVASVTDPLILDAVGHRDGREEVYRAAAAERAMLDADRVAATVRQLGADVVTATPAELPPALADRYLALKAAGRL
jgi:uncharacterized protein (DUF58 family)